MKIKLLLIFVALVKLLTAQEIEFKVSKGHNQPISAIQYSPNSEFIITTSLDKTVKLWSARSCIELRSFVGHEKEVKDARFSPDGNYILSCSFDKTLKLWDIKSGNIIRTFTGHGGYPVSVSFSRDGKKAASVSEDFGDESSLRIWDVNTGKQLINVHNLYDFCKVNFSPDGTCVLTGSSDGKLKIWDAATGQLLKEFPGHSDANGIEKTISSAYFTPDGRRIISSAWDKKIKLWDLATSAEAINFSGHNKLITNTDISADSKYLASCSADFTVKIWEISTGKVISSFDVEETPTAVKFSPDGTGVLCGFKNGTVRLLYLKPKGRIKNFLTNNSMALSSAISGNGAFLSVGYYNEQLAVWDLAGIKKIRKITVPGYIIRSIKYSWDDQQLIGVCNCYDKKEAIKI